MTERPIVVKIGGSTLGAHDTSLGDAAELQRSGVPIVLVHGGGPAISDWLARLDTPTRFARGLRVTDAATLDVVIAVLAGLVNKQLVGQLTAAGARVLGLSGADGGMLRAQYQDVELGYVGRISAVQIEPLQAIMSAGFMPLIAPIAVLNESPAQLMNVNADTVAGEIAAALGAARLIFLTDVAGIHDRNGVSLSSIDRAMAESLLAGGVIAGGMIPKIEAGLRAGEAGVATLIVDGRQPHGLLAALEAEPPGTMIDAIPAKEIRAG